MKSLDNYLPVSDNVIGDYDWEKFKLELIVNNKSLIVGYPKDMFYKIDE